MKVYVVESGSTVPDPAGCVGAYYICECGVLFWSSLRLSVISCPRCAKPTEVEGVPMMVQSTSEDWD